MINKLDPHLRVRTKALRGAAAEPAAPEERVEVIVGLTGNITDLEAVGFTPRNVFRTHRNC